MVQEIESAQIDLSVFQYYFKQNICKKKSRNNFDLWNLKSKLKKRNEQEAQPGAPFEVG